MRYYIIAISLFCCAFSHAQTPNEINKKAFEFFNEKKQFDSALYYYRLYEQNPEPGDVLTLEYNWMGECYAELGDFKNAEIYFLKCLAQDMEQDVTGYAHKSACVSLSDIYYKQNKFSEALDFLAYSRTKYKPLLRLCQGTRGGFEGHLIFNYKKSRIYYALGLKDSAFLTLAQWVFRPPDDVFIDSMEYIDISRFLVSVAGELYGESNLRRDLQIAIDRAFWNVEYEKDKTHGYITAWIECGFNWYGARVLLYTGGVSVDKIGELPEHWNKGSFLEEITKSHTYRFIFEGAPVKKITEPVVTVHYSTSAHSSQFRHLRN